MHAGRRAATLTLVALLGAAAGCSSTPAPTQAPKRAPAPAVALKFGAAQAAALMVVDDYERAGSAVKSGKPRKANPAGITAYVANSQVAAKLQGAGGVAAPIGCGVASGRTVVDGALVGQAVPYGTGGIAVPVTLYTGTRSAARLTLDTDANGRVTDFSCGPAADPGLPGSGAIVGYYGGAAAAFGQASSDATMSGLRTQYLAPAFASFTRPELDGDQTTCAEDGAVPYWHAVYAPGVSRTGADWYFWPGGDDQVVMSVAVDRTAPKVDWVYCVGQLTPQLAPAAYSDDQVKSYVGGLFDSYAYLQALKPYGADTSAMASYFVTPTAYRNAAAATGAQPLECAPKAAGSITPDDVRVSGTTAVVTLTANPTAHALTAGETALGHPKVTLDLPTMKITAVSCD